MFAAVFRRWSFSQDRQHINCQIDQQSNYAKNDESFPADLPGRILDLQLKCEGECINESLVFQLVNAYKTVVEHYQQRNDRRYKLYQKRMKNFLNKPLIRHLLRAQNKELAIKRQMNSQVIRQAQINAGKQAKQFLIIQQQKQKKQKSWMQKQLSKQNQKLEDRIREKRVKSNISTKSKNSVANEESSKKQVCNFIDKKLILKGIEERSRVLRKVYF